MIKIEQEGVNECMIKDFYHKSELANCVNK